MNKFKDKKRSIMKFALFTLPFFLLISSMVFILILGMIQKQLLIDNFFGGLWFVFTHNLLKVFIWNLFSLVIYVIIIFALMQFYFNFGLFVRTSRTTEHGGARWIVDEEQYRSSVMVQKFNEIYPISTKNSQSGWVVRAKNINNHVVYNTRSKTQALCLGATGSGKTQKIIIPSAIYNAGLSQAKKPCMVFTDPKGELTEKLGKILINQGYEILILNLRKPNYSNGWNPLSIAFKYFWDAIHFEKNHIKTVKVNDLNELNKLVNQNECFDHEKKSCQSCLGLVTMLKNEYVIYIYKNEKWFAKKEKLNYFLKIHTTELKALAFEEIENLVTVLFPLPKTDNPIWTINAGRMVAGVIYAMLEVLENDEQVLTVNHFNLTTVSNILSKQKQVVAWFQRWGEKYPNSKAFLTVAPIINSAEVTRQGIFSNITPALKIFEDLGLQNITCVNEIDLFSITEKPKAIFLIIPDEKTNRHILGSLFISQLYTASVFIANNNKGTLARPIQFYLDEFGNMPLISDFSNYITVARSRNMFFMLVLQDFKQLYEKYGPEKGATIKNNCNLNIYIQTNDHDTAESYSKMIGDHTVITRTRNTGPKFEDRLGGNYQQSGIPLIKAADLMRLKDPYGVVLFAKENPAKIYMDYAYNLYRSNDETYEINKYQKMKIIDFYEDYYFNLLAYQGNFEPKIDKTENPDNVSVAKPL